VNLEFSSISPEMLTMTLRAAVEAGRELRYRKDRALNIQSKEDDSPVTIADENAHRIIFDILKESGIPILSEEGRDIPLAERQSWEKFWMIDPLDGTKEFIKGRNEYTINIALIEKKEAVFGLIAVPELNQIYCGESGGCSYRFMENDLSGDFSIAREKATLLPDQTDDSEYRVLASRSHLSKQTEAYIDELRKEKGEIVFVQAGSALKFCRLAEGKADIYPRFTPCMEWDTAAGHAILKGVGRDILKVEDGRPLEYDKPDLLSPFFIAK
jgi:3'(2'), 5'-bisphosphate nucleotidase